MRNGPVSLALVLSALVACGDDGGPRLIDSGIGNTDANRVCTAMTPGEIDVTGELKDRSLTFFQDLGMINGDPAGMRIELYRSVYPNLMGTFDLAADPKNQDYATCGICFLAFTVDTNTNMIKKYYFQQSGSITFTADPITERHLTATITDLKLQEVSLNNMTAATTYNPSGGCTTLASGMIDTDNIPNEWSCPATDYYVANDCHCGCGTYDPDCRTVGTAVQGCTTATPACWPDVDAGTVCVAKPANDTCATAGTALTIGTPVNGTTIGADRNYSMGLETAACTKYRQPGPEVAYQVVLTAAVSYTFTLSGLTPDHDGSIALVGPAADATACSAAITTCVAGYDEGYGGDDEVFSYTPAATGTYYVIVDSYNNDDGGPFTLTVTQ